MDGHWATKSEDVALIVRAISFQDVQPTVGLCGRDPPTSRTDRRHAIAIAIPRFAQ